MKHFFKKIAFVLFGALMLTGCDLDQVDNYTFQYQTLIYLSEEDEDKKEEQSKAIEEYFKSKIDFDKTYSFHGPYYDATVYGCDMFENDIKAFTNDEVLALLGKDDQVCLALYMFSSKGNMGAVSAVYWVHDPDAEKGEEGEGGEEPKE